MKKSALIAVVMVASAALTATAMPTDEELAKARSMVDDVTAIDVKALKTGKAKPSQVAVKHLELAARAENDAEKFLLLRSAFRISAKAGDYEIAARAFGTMNREIADMDPEVLVGIYNKTILTMQVSFL